MHTEKRKKILITHPYFLPAFKAGGPIQSMANLCRNLYKEADFYIVCSDKDHLEKESLKNIKQDQWNDFENGTARVYYISGKNNSRKTITDIITDINPEYIFINGIYSPLFTLTPLFYTRGDKVVSARGMLHAGALSQKAWKKKIYLAFLKLSGIKRKITWHATDEQEAVNIKFLFGNLAKVIVAQNFPNQLKNNFEKSNKNEILKIVSIALISPMKNHALVIEALQNIKEKLTYDIYGPVKDAEYWAHCQELIKILPPNITVNYHGSLEPSEVAQTLRSYHCLVQPSKSENFGHSIYEALASGLPVITSNFTPWNDLEKNNAGWNVDINNIQSITDAITKAIKITKNEYSLWSNAAVKYAAKNIDINKIKDQYRLLFNL